MQSPEGAEFTAKKPRDLVRDVAEELGTPYPVAFERSGNVARAYGVRELPASGSKGRRSIVCAITLGSLRAGLLAG
jgi:hypothetical protein